MTDSNGNMIMPVAPYYGGGNTDGMFGGNGSWMWFLLIWMAMFGWGNGSYGFGGGQAGGRVGNEIQNGFDHQAVMNAVNGRYMSRDGSYADGYSQGYSEAMNQSGHWPMPPYRY